MDQLLTKGFNFIKEIQESELQADLQRKELISVQKNIKDIKNDTSLLEQKYEELKTDYDVRLADFIRLEFDAKHLEKTETLMLTDTLPEKKKTHDTENSVLEDLRNDIWLKRRVFCDRAREFNDKFGVLAPNATPTAVKLNQAPVLPTPMIDEEESNLLKTEVASLENKLHLLLQEQTDWNARQIDAEKELERLTNKHDIANYLMRGKKTLIATQNEIDMIEAQCVNVQKDINYQEMLMKAGGQSAMQRSSYAYANKFNANTQSYSKYESLTRGVQSGASIHNKFTSARSVVEDSGKTISLGDHVTHSITEEWENGLSESPIQTVLQEKDETTSRKLFIPKTPSLMTQRLLSSKKSSLALEQTFLNITMRSPAPIPSSRELMTGENLQKGNSRDGNLKPKMKTVGQETAVGSGDVVHKTPLMAKPYIA